MRDRGLIQIAVDQAGALTAAQALGLGFTYAQLRWRERAGQLRRVRKGLYVHTAFSDSWEQRLWVEVLAAGERTVVSTQAACALHGFRRSQPGVIEVQTPEGGSHTPVFGTIHETFWLPRSHIVEVNKLPVTSVARTVFDVAGHPKHPLAFQNDLLRANHVKQMTWLVNHAIRDHGMRMLDLDRVLASTGRRGKPGTAIIREIVADLGVDYAPSASELQDLFSEMLDAYGVPRPDEEIDLGTAERWVGRVDFVWRRQRVIVEVDGRQHGAPLDRRADRARDSALGGEGWTIIRVTRAELVHEPEKVIARIRLALAAAA
ncbi:MAG TPA: DUF559 domain-containing protein [Acidimicrobiales bacterium]|nr:DUF559 domain-containing protein [Acidimicrobiales bacterium]